jgi:hypothetical protein
MSVSVGTDYDPRWHSGDFERDGGDETWNTSKGSLYLMPAGWLALELSVDFPWRRGWCTVRGLHRPGPGLWASARPGPLVAQIMFRSRPGSNDSNQTL